MTEEYVCPVCPTGIILFGTEVNDDDEVACDTCDHFLSAGEARQLERYEE